MKVCAKCKIEKEESQFYKSSQVKSGLLARCKACVIEDTKKWPEKNREKSNEIKKLYKLKNREAYLKKQREYAKDSYDKNPEEWKKRHRDWIEKNPEIAKESNRLSAAKSFQKHKPERVKKAREYRENNREKVRESSRKYKAENYDKIISQHKEYWARYPEKYKATRAVNNAIAKGKMTRPTQCSRCEKECKPEGHHPDYSKPLEVIWLCRECHKKEHGK
jgi:hypothetical protein